MTKRDAVLIWTEESGTHSWSKQIFEDLGGADLVRTYVGWYAGSGPGAVDMVIDSEIRSQSDGQGAMTDTYTYEGAPAASDVVHGQPAVYLRAQLATEARFHGTLYLYRSVR